MSRGYPDYFGFALFPKYGTIAQQEKGVFVIPSGDTGTVFEILGKGQIFGGWINIVNNAQPAQISVEITLDTVEFLSTTLQTLHFYLGEDAHRAFPVSVTYLDQIIQQYRLQIDHDWTYETDYKVNIKNQSAGALQVDGVIFFYRIV